MGPQGPTGFGIGFDGNSSMWKWTTWPGMGTNYFTTHTGNLGISVINAQLKDQVTAIRINKTDDVTVQADLIEWLLFCDVGSTIYIRGVNDVHEVAYYQVTNRYPYNNNEVKYNVIYIDGDVANLPPNNNPNEFIQDKQYYIGYINNTTVSAMNGARWISDGNNTPSALGRFSLTSSAAPNNPGWNDANSIVINDTPIIFTPNASNPSPQPSDFTNWIQSIRENAIITIRQRGNPNNFGIYRVNSLWTPSPVGANQSYFAGITYITSNNEGAPEPPTTTPATPPGFMIGDHPADPTASNVNQAFPLDVEFEISYAAAGEEGPRGEQGERGETGPAGPAGPGLNGAVGVSFSMELTGSPTKWNGFFRPPSFLANDVNGNYPYIIYTGHDSNNDNLAPEMAKWFEFLHLEGQAFATMPPGVAAFPRQGYDQNLNMVPTQVNGHKLPELGPGNTSHTHNNMFGFRITSEAELLGFQINFINSAGTGMFHAFIYTPYQQTTTTGGELRFNGGGPIVYKINPSPGGGSAPFSSRFSSANTIFEPANRVTIKANSYLFIASDLSCLDNGPNDNLWNGPNGPGFPFRPPSGTVHATAYIRYI